MAQEMTNEQKQQAIIDFNKELDVLRTEFPKMTNEQKQEAMQRIAQRKAELGLE